MGMGQGVRTGLGHGGIPCDLQSQFSRFFKSTDRFTDTITSSRSHVEVMVFFNQGLL